MRESNPLGISPGHGLAARHIAVLSTLSGDMAERGGVEPPRLFRARLFSRQVPSPIGLPLRGTGYCGTGGESRPRNLPVKGRVLCLLSYASMDIGGPDRNCTCVARVAAACLVCSATGPWQRWQGSNLRDTRGNNPRLYRLSYIAMGSLGYWCVQKDSNLRRREPGGLRPPAVAAWLCTRDLVAGVGIEPTSRGASNRRSTGELHRPHGWPDRIRTCS